MIRETVDDRRLASAAGALGAGRQDADAGVLDDIEHGAFKRDGEGEPAAHELDLERSARTGSSSGRAANHPTSR